MKNCRYSVIEKLTFENTIAEFERKKVKNYVVIN